MATKDTSALFIDAQSQHLAIAFFRLPGSQRVQHISGGTTRQMPEGERSFVFAPFDSKAKPYFISASAKLPLIKDTPRPKKVVSISKKNFTDYVKSILSVIYTGKYQKIVAARIFATDRPQDFHPITFFEKVCATYPQAFVSLTYIPGVGIWLGASPEVLASQNSHSVTTYALAGTKAIDDKTQWADKEKQEQGIVTDFIQDKLSKVTEQPITSKGPVTRAAGSLKHLLTVFDVPSVDADLWHRVATALHPTPAVSGMPQAMSVKFIKDNEAFDRKFYAGYLGPVHWSGKTDVFVNLRCMEITREQLIFYAGCGVTADSNPDREWLESERKLDILRKLCL